MPFELSDEAAVFLKERLSPQDYVIFCRLMNGETFTDENVRLDQPFSSLGQMSPRLTNLMEDLTIRQVIQTCASTGQEYPQRLKTALLTVSGMGDTLVLEIIQMLHEADYSDEDIHRIRHQK